MNGLATCLNVSSSVKNRRWTFRYDLGQLDEFSLKSGCSALQSALLLGRGVVHDDVEAFLDPKLKNSLVDPSKFEDMDLASKIILDCIEETQKLTIFSDYDVDGGTSAAQLIRWARTLNFECDLYVPDRIKEGFGPSKKAFDEIKESGADLVVTLDCGAAAYDALEYADKIGLDVIVIDHHQMDEARPPARALVNPNRQDDLSGQGHLAAAGVTFMLLVALQREARQRGHATDFDLKSLLGLTALGTICDVVPLKGLNRAIVKQGLLVLSANHNMGIQALADISNIEPPFTTYHAGFVLGPRINAGGRIGSSEMGARLLSTEDSQLAYSHAAELDRMNLQRRQMQDTIYEEAVQKAQSRLDDPVIIIAMEDWHAGIIGIVAGRLKDRLSKPVIVIAIDNMGEAPLAKGSGRSIKGVDLGGALTAAMKSKLLLSGGGHAMAGGLSMAPDKIDDFRDFMCERLQADVETAILNDTSKVDFVLNLSAVNENLMEVVDTLGPYGAGNPEPVFAIADLRVRYAKRLKGGHVRFTLSDAAGKSLSGICFRANESGLGEALLMAGDTVFHALGRVKRNLWQGRTSIDFHLQDLAPV